MSDFSQRFSAAAAAMLDPLMGYTVVATTPGGNTIGGLVGRIDRQLPMQEMGASGRESETQSGEISFSAAQFAAGVAPEKGWRLNLSGDLAGEIWTIETTPRLHNGQYDCTCKRGGVTRINDRKARG
jgi:hypothetical protein